MSGKRVAAVLGRWTDELTSGTIDVIPEGESPLKDVELPAVVTAAWYGDQSAGGNVLALTTRAAKRLAAQIVGAQEAEESDDEQITEIELSALDEAMGHVMSAAGAAASDLLGREIATGSPHTQTVADAVLGAQICAPAEHVCAYSFTVCGEGAHLIQVVPKSFLAQASRRIAEAREEATVQAAGSGAAVGSSEDAIRGVPVHVWAELGRLRMPLARAVGLPPGVVVEFDCGADDPIDLFVNGRRFATGRLLVGEGRWAVEIQNVLETVDSAG